jgi:hypothetical protein
LFNKKKDNESDFCESYKSEILGGKPSKKESSFFRTIIKLLTILILLVIIIGVSYYGYNYFINGQKINNNFLPPVSMQISDEDLVVQMEEENIEPETIELVKENAVKKEEKTSIPLLVTTQVEELEIDKIANDVKTAIAKSELKEANETKIEKVESLEIPTVLTPEAKYLEELADLSKEIDKE